MKILDATALTGTFATVTGLPSGWTINYNKYNPGEVSLSYLISLPVTLASFTAKKQDTSVKLDWQTSSETNHQGFAIEQRLDGDHWKNIGFVDGHGSAKYTNTYAFLDQNPLPGINYYRLKQIDLDGQFEYSRIVGTRMKNEQEVKVYPNPATGIIYIEGASAGVKIMDILGRQVLKGTITHQQLDVSGLPVGIYIMKVFSENKKTSIPIVKQ